MREVVSRDGAIFAEFASADDLLTALARLNEEGYTGVETFTPFDVPGVEGRTSEHRSRLPFVIFAGGALGAITAYAIQWYANVYSYPLNIGGRPVHALPAFLVPTFESAVLFGALFAFVGFFVVLRLPRLWHPVFEIDGFTRATGDRYWVAVSLANGQEDAVAVERELAAFAPIRIVRVEDRP